MSGPVTAPLTVSTIDGLTVGRPISVIKVSNGTLAIAGNQATLTIGGGTGTVTSIATTAPITGGTITATGTIGITQSATAADGYLSSTDWNTFNNKTSNTGTVTSVGSAQAFITITTATTTPSISIGSSSALATGVLTAADWTTFNSKGSGTVTSITAGTGLDGGTITTTGTIDLADTAVSPGAYTSANITIDQQGRITTAASGGGVTFPLEGSDGSAALPTYSFSSDTNTGIYRAAADQVNITLGGTRLFDFEKSGTSGKFQFRGGAPIIECDDAGADLSIRSGGGTYGEILISNENYNIEITPAGTGLVKISDAFTLPGAVTASNDYILTAQTDGTTAWTAASGGAGTITGTITDKKVAFGDTTPDSIQGSTSFTYNDTTKVLSIGAGTGTPTVQSGSADLILRNSSAEAHSKITIGYDVTDSDIILDTDGAGVVNIYSEGVKAYNLPKVTALSNDQILTAQTDGSTAWADAPAGAVAPTIDPSQTTFATFYAAFQPLTGCAPYGTNGNSNSASTDYYPSIWVVRPFIASRTDTLAGVSMACVTAQVGSNMQVAIYSADAYGMPETLKGTGSVPLTATGRITATLAAAAGQDLDLVKGTLYYVGWFGDNSGTPATIGVIGQGGYSSIAFGGGNTQMGPISAWKMTSATTTTAPATFVTNQTTYDGFPYIGGDY